MKNLYRFLLTLACISFFSLNAFAQSFEGVMTMEIAPAQAQGNKMTMTTSVKGDKSVMEMKLPQGNMKMFVDQEAGKMTMVMEAMKMGMVTDLKKLEEAAKKMPMDSMPPTVTATGDKKTINGHDCERYNVVTHNGDSSVWWMTKDIPKNLLKSMRSAIEKGMSGGMRAQRKSAIGGAIEAMFKKDMMPMQIVSKQATITFVGFEERKLDDSIFVVPSDITIQEMPSGMGGGQ